jgi:hypothetical protein
MKQYLFLFAFVVFNLQTFAQTTDFAPVGAIWYYREISTIMPYPEKFRLVEVTEEAVYQGKLCRKIEGLTGCGLPNPCYVFSQNDSVFYWSLNTAMFQLLYDFSALPGDSWDIAGLLPPFGPVHVLVDSLTNKVVGNDTLKVWHINYTPDSFDWGNEILEKVGNACFLGPSSDLCENGPCGIRCYADPDMDYHFVPYPCDTAIFTSKSTELSAFTPIHLLPNPFHESITLHSNYPLMGYSFRLYDQLGQLVHKQVLAAGDVTIETTDLPPGIYFGVVGDIEKGYRVEKLVKTDRN